MVRAESERRWPNRAWVSLGHAQICEPVLVAQSFYRVEHCSKSAHRHLTPASVRFTVATPIPSTCAIDR